MATPEITVRLVDEASGEGYKPDWVLDAIAHAAMSATTLHDPDVLMLGGHTSIRTDASIVVGMYGENRIPLDTDVEIGSMLIGFPRRGLSSNVVRIVSDIRGEGKVEDFEISGGGKQLEEMLQMFFRRIYKRRENWHVQATTAVEKLIKRISVLTDDRDALIAKLAKVYGDLDVAKARVEQLEAMLDSLSKEQFRTKGKASKKLLAAYALVVATLLGPALAVGLDHALDDPIKETVEAAHDVQQICGDTNVTINVPPAPPIPATS